MKKTVSFILALSIILLSLSACFPNGEIILTEASPYTDHDGVYITIDSVDTSGEYDELCAVWHNETENRITYGLWYVIEYKTDGEWKNVATADIAIPEIACVLDPQSTGMQSYSTKHFNLSKAGTYRLRVEFYITNADVSDSGTAYAEFEVAVARN